MGRNLSRSVFGIPLSTMITAQALFLMGALASGLLGVFWPAAFAIGLALALPWVIHVRGRFLTTLIRTRWSYAVAKRDDRTAELPEAFDITGPDGDRIGVRWDGEVITSMIRLLPVRAEVTSMRGGTAFTRDTVPLRVLADALDQFDIALEGIDVVCLGARTVGESLQASVYERLLGPLPAIARRNTWLTVRFRPRSCPEAVARRGGDTTGALRAAAVATTRIVRKLAESGHAARVLPALDVNAAIAQLTGGVPVDRFEQRWDCAASPREVHTSFVADRSALSGDALAPVWGPVSRHTALTLQIRPAPADGATVGAVVRYLTPGPAQLPRTVPLRLLAGRQQEALLASLPFGGRGQAPIADPAVLDGEALEQISIPASGCGQLVGADEAGNAIAVRIAAPDVRRVDIVGGLFLAQQVTLRAIAIGARVLVHTDRPHAWQPMVDAIGAEQVLRVATAAAASSQANSEREYTVVLLDGAESGVPRADLTVIRLLSDEVPARAAGVPDIRLVQPDVHEETFDLHIGDRRLTLSMVSIPDELRIIGASQPGRRAVGVR
ncbi:type VII secretion protein EccE [Speluncibacter jeojiensis]|uniref:Type VII secretion protein EccE n=1 Tax=Speluncibacter jeojiensis TaxID=2710754 RepID=A0A9X4M1V6_9ACTN|nr:type VII secretion protein EccE [Corynebacteriales bacterium D3-21]